MKEKIILAFFLVCLSMFGLRGILPKTHLIEIVGITTVVGLLIVVIAYVNRKISARSTR